MKDFLSRHTYLIIWILALLIIGSMAILIIQLNSITIGLPESSPRAGTGTAGSPAAPAVPAAPSVTLTIVTSAGGNSLSVQWQNLPANTVALDIFRGKTGATSTWQLWKTITITSDQLGSGNTSIDIGNSLEEGYSFYVEAVTGGGPSDDDWTSSSTVPDVTTTPPTPPSPPANVTPPPDVLPPSTPPPSPPGDTSSTPPAPPPQNTPPPSSPTTTPSSTPPGDPYYNPQVQITGYGTAPGSFWVEHVNQSIEIGWQNIPADVDTIIVARTTGSATSTGPTGPWNTIITQHNPGANGSYSLQLVDNSLSDPYYYQMTALDGTATVATYGPVFVAPQ